MHRSTRRRLIVALALLSHLVTALFVHVPMAYAGMAHVEAGAQSSQPPCPDHASRASSSSAHPHDCQSGICKCPCAHGQALAVMPTLPAPAVPHLPSVDRYRVPQAPDSETSFFRPPI